MRTAAGRALWSLGELRLALYGRSWSRVTRAERHVGGRPGGTLENEAGERARSGGQRFFMTPMRIAAQWTRQAFPGTIPCMGSLVVGFGLGFVVAAQLGPLSLALVLRTAGPAERIPLTARLAPPRKLLLRLECPAPVALDDCRAVSHAKHMFALRPDGTPVHSRPHGEWRSLVAHPAGGRAVAGSNPVSPITQKAC